MISIESIKEKTTLRLSKDLVFNFFSGFMVIIQIGGLIIISFFIINSYRSDALGISKLLFIAFGIIGLITVLVQLKGFLILILRGQETIEIDDKSIHYIGVFGSLTKKLSFKIDQIKKLEIITIKDDAFSQASNMFTEIKHGVIVIMKSKRKRILVGQSLSEVDLNLIYNELRKNIHLPTRR